MARPQKRKLSKKEEAALKKQPQVSDEPVVETVEVKKDKKRIEIPAVISVKEFSDIMEMPVTTVISKLIKNGVLANINENIDIETAQIIGDDLGFEVELKSTEATIAEEKTPMLGKNFKERPPVVAIMGHVDHGKTSLLDKIRETSVAAKESGGITQHISAFEVEINYKKIKNRSITFIDTPGHAAFSAMRAHGASITDLVVLIVAADDGVMPQTVEVIEQAKANNVPIIVAINKIDKPGADPMKVKQQLADHGLNSEEWGGDTIIVEVSAITGQGIEKLLESILLFSDIKEYKADPDEMATGVVIESHMHKGSGPLAIVLIENGSLKKGDHVVVGQYYGKVRILLDSYEKPISVASPSMPVRIAGLNGLPTFGDRLLAVNSEKEAKNQAEMQHGHIAADFVTAKKISEEESLDQEIKELNLILIADVKGSLEAIKSSLNQIHHPEIKLNLVHEGIGKVSESDINMARSSKAQILAFRSVLNVAARRMAELENVMIKSYDVIYDLLQYVKDQMSQLLPPEVIESEVGRLRILATFRFDRKRTIFGGMVESGELHRNDKIKIFRGEKLIYEGQIEALRQGKDESASVSSGSECGVSVAAMVDVLKDDLLIANKVEEVKRVIE